MKKTIDYDKFQATPEEFKITSQIKKCDITMDLLSKIEIGQIIIRKGGPHKIWIKPTSKRKGHWRKIKGGMGENPPSTPLPHTAGKVENIERDIKTYENKGNLLKHELSRYIDNYSGLSKGDRLKMNEIKNSMETAYSNQMAAVVEWQGMKDVLYKDYNEDIVTSDIPHTEHSMDRDNVVKIEALGDIPNAEVGINVDKTNVVTFKDGSSGIYKPTRESSIIGEVGAYRTAQIIGWDIVPETVAVDLGEGVGSCQRWIEDVDNLEYDHGWISNLDSNHMDDLSKILILDMLLGDADDRHVGNIALKGDRVYMIDNEIFGRPDTVESSFRALDEFISEENYVMGSRQLTWMNSIKTPIEFEDEQDEQDYYDFYEGSPERMEFYDKVKTNISDILDHKEEIMIYYDNQPNITTPFAPIYTAEAADNIRANFDKLEWHAENMSDIYDN